VEIRNSPQEKSETELQDLKVVVSRGFRSNSRAGSRLTRGNLTQSYTSCSSAHSPFLSHVQSVFAPSSPHISSIQIWRPLA
jgi:hypothetical protein